MFKHILVPESAYLFTDESWIRKHNPNVAQFHCENCRKPLGEHLNWKCYPSEERMVTHPASDLAFAREYAVTFEGCFVETESDTPLADGKETNPKDAIGSTKAPMSTLPAGVLAECGVAMFEGAAKYGKFNYRQVGVRTSVYYDAAMRHLMSFYEGEDIDPDSGMPHVIKAIVSLMVLRDAQRNGKVTDDRPPRSSIDYPKLNALVADIAARHADKKPRHYTIEDTHAIEGADADQCNRTL